LRSRAGVDAIHPNEEIRMRAMPVIFLLLTIFATAACQRKDVTPPKPVTSSLDATRIMVGVDIGSLFA
jgi:hypothetical protein